MAGEKVIGEDTGEDEEIGEVETGALAGLDTTGFTKADMEALAELESEESEAKAPQEAEGKEPEEPEAVEHPKGYVPNQALREARDELKTTKQQLAELTSVQTRLFERMTERQAAQQSAEDTEPQEIDVNEDPLAYIQQVGQRVEDMVHKQNQTAEQQVRAQEQFNRENVIIDNVVKYRNELAAKDPHAAEAFDFAVEATVKAYEDRGYAGQQLRNAVRGEMLKYANNAPNDEAALKQYTLQNAWFWGFGQGQAKPNGEEKTVDAAAKLQRLSSAQAASKTLSGGGKSVAAEYTIEDVEALSGGELDRLAMDDPKLFARLEEIARNQ